MALTGLHVQFTYASDDGDRIFGATIGKPVQSSNVASGGQSAAAPSASQQQGGSPIARLNAAEDGYYGVGSNPNASNNPRGFLRAGETIDIFVETGDKIAWLTA